MLHHDHPELRGAQYVVFADSSRRYLDCTDGVCQLLGYTRDEVLNKAVEDVSYNIDVVPQLFAQYLKTGKQEGEYVLQRKDRTPVPIRYRAFVFNDGCNAAIWEPIKDWREPYLAALLEVDPARLRYQLEVALAAVQQARDSEKSGSGASAERQALSDAISALNSLMKNTKRASSTGR